MSWEQMARYLDEMAYYIQARDWDGLEQHYHDICGQLSGPAWAERISAVSLIEYGPVLSQGLHEALARAHRLRARAVYFEYDLDNGWDSHFFICQNYRPELPPSHSDPDWDDWACDWIDEVEGPSQTELAAIYQESPEFFETQLAQGLSLYLVAKTVAAFGRVSDGVDPRGIAVCLAYHDGDIIRLYEAE